MNKPSLEAFRENEPFCFISYAHADGDVALNIISLFQQIGANVWYDEFTPSGVDWKDYIAEKIETCSFFIPLFSPNYMDSHDCRAEIGKVVTDNIPTVPVFLYQTQLTPGIAMYISGIQSLMFFNQNTNHLLPYKTIKKKLDDEFKDKILSHPSSNLEKTETASNKSDTVSADYDTKSLQTTSKTVNHVILTAAVFLPIILIAVIAIAVFAGKKQESDFDASAYNNEPDAVGEDINNAEADMTVAKESEEQIYLYYRNQRYSTKDEILMCTGECLALYPNDDTIHIESLSYQWDGQGEKIEYTFKENEKKYYIQIDPDILLNVHHALSISVDIDSKQMIYDYNICFVQNSIDLKASIGDNIFSTTVWDANRSYIEVVGGETFQLSALSASDDTEIRYLNVIIGNKDNSSVIKSNKTSFTIPQKEAGKLLYVYVTASPDETIDLSDTKTSVYQRLFAFRYVSPEKEIKIGSTSLREDTRNEVKIADTIEISAIPKYSVKEIWIKYKGQTWDNAAPFNLDDYSARYILPESLKIGSNYTLVIFIRFTNGESLSPNIPLEIVG